MFKNRKSLIYVCIAVVSFWWLPLSLWRFSAIDIHKELVLKHALDGCFLHFGKITFFLPIVLYVVGRGFVIFSSARFLDSHHAYQPYQGLELGSGGQITSLSGEVVYNFSITKTVVWLFIIALFMIFLFIGLYRYYRKKGVAAPRGYWMLPLLLVKYVRNEIAYPNIGKKHAERFTPYLLTLFFFILFSNLAGLLPEGPNITGNVSITLMLALFTLIITLWNGNKHYWKHLFKPSGVPVWMLPIMIPVEFMGLLVKPFTLMLRLTANMFSGHMILLALMQGIFEVQSIIVAPVVILMLTFMLILKIFVCFLQAYIFTLLSAKIFGEAVHEKEHG